MVYSKSRLHDTPDIDPWQIWLTTIPQEDYNLLFWEDTIQVEFYNTDRATEFVLEFGL